MIARSALLPALALTALAAGTALAQTDPKAPAETAAAEAPDTGAAYESARNQLGVLNYCQGKGYIDGKAVETQTKLLAMIPPGDGTKGDAAEALGKAGTVSAMGVERSLTEAATDQKTTEDALCKQMDALLHQLAAQIPS